MFEFRGLRRCGEGDRGGSSAAANQQRTARGLKSKPDAGGFAKARRF